MRMKGRGGPNGLQAGGASSMTNSFKRPIRMSSEVITVLPVFSWGGNADGLSETFSIAFEHAAIVEVLGRIWRGAVWLLPASTTLLPDVSECRADLRTTRLS